MLMGTDAPPSPPLSPAVIGPPPPPSDYNATDFLPIGQEELREQAKNVTRVQRRNDAQKVTGLVVNDRPGVSRQVMRRLRAILHRAKSEGLDAQNRAGRPDFRGWLEGMIASVGMVRPEARAKLRAEFESIRGNP